VTFKLKLADADRESEWVRLRFLGKGSLRPASHKYRIQNGEPERTEFVAFTGAYHGDTLRATSLGGVGKFSFPFIKILRVIVHLVNN